MHRSKLFKIVCVCSLFWAVSVLCEHLTGGFRLHEIFARTLPEGRGAPHPALNQNYFFLGGGQQFYAFLSEDGTTVLKFFRHDHFGPKQFVRLLPSPSFLEPLKQRILNSQARDNLSKLYESVRLSFETCKEESGLLYLHLGKTAEKMGVTLYDKTGVQHKVDLAEVPFFLQKRADPFCPSLEKLMQQGDTAGAKALIHSLFAALNKRCTLGIRDTDTAFKRNVGAIGTQAIAIDVGSWIKDPSLKREEEIHAKTNRLARWIKKHYPELLPTFEEELKK